MEPVRFNPEKDLAPLPFDKMTCDMRHFFSDYQTTTRDFFKLNSRMNRLAEMDKAGQPNLYRHAVDEITLMFERHNVSKD